LVKLPGALEDRCSILRLGARFGIPSAILQPSRHTRLRADGSYRRYIAVAGRFGE
jgi:hypothetical protein